MLSRHGVVLHPTTDGEPTEQGCPAVGKKFRPKAAASEDATPARAAGKNSTP